MGSVHVNLYSVESCTSLTPLYDIAVNRAGKEYLTLGPTGECIFHI